MSYERRNIQAMAGYVSGEQPDSTNIVKMNTNENPFPPGPAVAQALAEITVDSLRRYPPPTASSLSNSIAKYHNGSTENNLSSDNVIVTNGGDELLRLAITTFVEKNGNIAVAAPTYTLYEVLAQAHGCQLINFDLDDNWNLPENFSTMLNEAEVSLCLIPNPHAPSGQLLSVNELNKLASEFNGVLVIDEAYVDFVDPECNYNCVPLINTLDNVLILRTFSKGYSLAGLRMAYGLAAKSLIDPMQYKTKDSYNTDFIAQRLAQAAIEDQDYVKQGWVKVRQQRAFLSSALQDMNFTSLASQANFILVDVPTPFTAELIYQSLKDQGILVRFFNSPRLSDKLRITIGTEEENLNLLSTLQHIIATNT